MFDSLIVLCLGPQGQPWPGWSCCPPLTKPDKQNRTNKQTNGSKALQPSPNPYICPERANFVSTYKEKTRIICTAI